MRHSYPKQKIIIKRKNGRYTVKGDGDAYLFELAKGAYVRGEMEPTAGMKVRRFFRKLVRFFHVLNAEIQYHAETVTVNHIVGSEQAAEISRFELAEEVGR